MKFNWGTGVAIALALFMSFIIYMVVQFFGANVDLVEEDYYEQEVNYPERKEALQNSLEFVDLVEVSRLDGAIKVIFPEALNMSEAEGSLHLYNAVNADMDRVFSMSAETANEQYILLDGVVPGGYTLKIKFSIGEKNYYFEKELSI